MLKWFRDIKSLYTFQEWSKATGRNPKLSGLTPMTRADLLVERGRIVAIGSSQKIEKWIKANNIKHFAEIDCKGLSVFPGFVEAHTHLCFAGERAAEFERKIQGESYLKIAQEGGGILSTVSATRSANNKKLSKLVESRLLRFRDQGVVIVEAKTGYALKAKDELRILKLQKELKTLPVISTFLAAHALPPEFSSAAKYLGEMEVLAKKVIKNNLSHRADIFIEKGFFDKEIGRNHIQKLKSLGFEFCIHADQLSRQGATELGIELGALSVDHAICLSDSDIQALSRSETTAVLLPMADFYMKCSYPKARVLIDSGARVALATDYNPGTSPSQDLAFTGLLARLEMKMKLHEVWCAYTVGASHALGVQKDFGSLEVGKRASFIMTQAAPTDFFYSVGNMPVEFTVCSGKVFKSINAASR